MNKNDYILKEGNGFTFTDGTKIPTTIIELSNGEDYEFPTNLIDTMLIENIERGLNHPLQHLENIKYLIAFSSRKKQAKYSDNICMERINDVNFIKSQMDSIVNIDDIDLFHQFNATSVGNLALISLNAPKPYSDKAEAILIAHKKFVQEMLYKENF